jgi:hypothetical protein
VVGRGPPGLTSEVLSLAPDEDRARQARHTRPPLAGRSRRRPTGPSAGGAPLHREAAEQLDVESLSMRGAQREIIVWVPKLRHQSFTWHFADDQ